MLQNETRTQKQRLKENGRYKNAFLNGWLLGVTYLMNVLMLSNNRKSRFISKFEFRFV